MSARSVAATTDARSVEGSCRELFRTYAADCALAEAPVPFPREGSLAERLRDRPLIMAPMAGVSDAAWRMVARSGGAALAYSEMVSVAGLHFGSEKTWELVEPRGLEPDVAVQLFGSVPEQFREAAAAVAARLGSRLVLVDINMACPVPKVTRSGAGAALLDEPGRAAEIVAATRLGLADAGAEVPVTAKIRQGRRMGEEVAAEFARALEAAGADAVAVHGRFAQQLYQGTADWGAIARVVEATTIPVIGSGDVFSHDDARAMLDATGCAAVMVARGSYGNPWVFSGHVPTCAERLACLRLHVRLLEATGAHMARARSLAGFYLKGMPHAAAWRQKAMECHTTADYLALADAVCERAGGL